MEELTTEDKLFLSYGYTVSCLTDDERAKKIKELLKRGFTYGKLALLWNRPRNTIFYWANPGKRSYYSDMAETDNKTEIIGSIQKEVDKKYSTKNYTNSGDLEFRKMAVINTKLKTALMLLRDVRDVNNEIGKEIVKKIKIEINRLNCK